MVKVDENTKQGDENNNGGEGTPPAENPAKDKKPGNKTDKKQNKSTPAKEPRMFRVAVRVNEILEITASGQSQAFEQLKKIKLGEVINRDNISFLGR